MEKNIHAVSRLLFVTQQILKQLQMYHLKNEF